MFNLGSPVRCSVIGAGRLGKNLIVALLHKGLVQLQVVCNTTRASSLAAVEQLGSGRPVVPSDKFDVGDLVWITVPDDQVAIVAMSLAEKKVLKRGTIVVHCSGVLSSDVLRPLAQIGCHTASLHPLKSFTATLLDTAAFSGCYCTIEGSEQALNVIMPLFRQLGAILHTIKPEKKMVYHAAATIVSNYLITLASIGIKLFKEAEMEPLLAKSMVEQLLQGSLRQIEQHETLQNALTGPLSRGDKNTIINHMAALTDPIIQQFYCAAARATLPVTELNEQQQQEMEALF